MYCPICHSTAAVGTALCPYCFVDPDAKPRRRRKRDEAILDAFIEGLRGTVKLPDAEEMWWALVSRLAERGPAEIVPAKQLRRSKSQ